MPECFGPGGGDCCEVLAGYSQGSCQSVPPGISKWCEANLHLHSPTSKFQNEHHVGRIVQPMR